jgi:hypothetical protein
MRAFAELDGLTSTAAVLLAGERPRSRTDFDSKAAMMSLHLKIGQTRKVRQVRQQLAQALKRSYASTNF